MKKYPLLLLFLFLFFLSKITAQECFPYGIIFSTQEQIDNFPNDHPGCTHILDGVVINESVTKNITNLDSLYQIIKISGNLSITSNAGSISLRGLKNLNAIGGNLLVTHNTSLSSLIGLGNLISIGGYLTISKNASLTSLSGLDNLTSIGGYMDVYDNVSLINLEGMESLTVVGEIINRNTLENKPYVIWVIPMGNSSKFRGYLRGVEDSLIRVSKYLNKSDLPDITESINIQNIEAMKFRRKGIVGRSILYGALTGFAIGGISGLIAGDDVPGRDCIDSDANILSSFFFFLDPCFSGGAKGMSRGLLLAIPGAFTGVTIGSIKVNIPINGNHKTFKKQRRKLQAFKVF